jgi:hypothetical protein
LPCFFQLRRFDFPDLLAAETRAAHEPGAGQHVQVLGNRLTRDVDSIRQCGNRRWSARTQAGHQPQSRRIAQRGKDRRRRIEPRFSSPR